MKKTVKRINKEEFAILFGIALCIFIHQKDKRGKRVMQVLPIAQAEPSPKPSVRKK